MVPHSEPGEINGGPSTWHEQALSQGHSHIILTVDCLDLISQLMTLSSAKSFLGRTLNTVSKLSLHYFSYNSYA